MSRYISEHLRQIVANRADHLCEYCLIHKDDFLASIFPVTAKENNANIVGLSSLLTTGDPHVEETINAIKNSDLAGKVKVICGGAAVTLKFVEACGADAHARDAADGVKKIKRMLEIK